MRLPFLMLFLAGLFVFTASRLVGPDLQSAKERTMNAQTELTKFIEDSQTLRELQALVLKHGPQPALRLCKVMEGRKRNICYTAVRIAGRLMAPLKPQPTCGVPAISADLSNLASSARIVGGGEAKRGSWPWMVQLKTKTQRGTSLCGGSLIDKNWVLTAAHCTLNKTTTVVKLGAHNGQNNDTLQILGVAAIHKHPRYTSDPNPVNNDIKLIRLSTPAVINDYVSTICLPAGDVIDDDQNCFATGWGRTAVHGGGVSDVLKQVRAPPVNDTICKRWRKMSDRQMENQFCAGFEIGGDGGVCHGDSGGPLVCKRGDGHFEQFGITSWGGAVCAPIGHPPVFVRVHAFVDWINTVMEVYASRSTHGCN